MSNIDIIVHCGKCNRDLYYSSWIVQKCPCGEFLYRDPGERVWNTEALQNAEKSINWSGWRMAGEASVATEKQIKDVQDRLAEQIRKIDEYMRVRECRK